MTARRGAPHPSLGRLLRNARFEVVPMRGAEEEATFLPTGTTVTVTASPRKGLEATLDLAERLAARGYRVVPHVSARLVRSRGHLQDLLGRMAGNGFDEVFVIGGDSPEPAGPYQSAGRLLADMAEMENAPKKIGIGCYPDGHPLLDDEELMRALLEKQPRASHMVTQICFDPWRIDAWLERVRAAGIHLPVYVGIPGVLKRRKLLEISLRVGVGESARFLTHHASLVARLVRRGMYRPDALVAEAAALVVDPDNRITGFHINTFNQVQVTERWRQQVLGLYAWDDRAEAGDDYDTAS